MSAEDWPDFWLKGKYIDWIETVNLVKTINTIGTIGTVETIETLETLNTVDTIQKINPKTVDSTAYNTVIDLIEKIKQIDNITDVGTLGTVNSVGTVSIISKINRINVIHDARIVPNFIQNGSFRTGDFTGWIGRSANAYIEYDSNYRDYVCVLPEQYDYVGQYLPPLYGEEARIKIRYRHEVDGGEVQIQLLYTDGTSKAYNFTASTGGVWYDAVVEPTKKVPLVVIMIWNLTDGSELRITGCEMLRKQLIYQAEKDRTISREGAVVHFSKSFSSAGSSDIALPASGKALRVLAWNLYCDADVVCELRFKNSGNVIAGLPAKGATAMNLVGSAAPTGDTDEPIEIYVSGAANVKGWVCVEEA